MYRKKLMRACLTGLMVVTVATANVAPVFAAEAPAGTETTTSKASVVKAQFVDEAGVVLAGGDYFVDVDGDGIFNHTEVLEWVPEGYELATLGDFQVEFYKETPLQLSVTKIAEEPENPDPEDPNKPEKPEDPDKEDTGKEDTNKKDDKKEDTKKEDKKKTSPKTGDETSAATAALPVGVSLAAILAVLVKKFK